MALAIGEVIASTGDRGMAAASPNLLTPEEAAVIARCSVKTVRRAYATGALTAYRRRGSRAVLLDNQDVLAWVRGQILQPTAPTTPALESDARPTPQPESREAGRRAARTPKLGSQLRFDLSADALRDRRARRRTLAGRASSHGRTLEKARRLAIRGPAWQDLAARLPRPRGPRPVQELQDQDRGGDWAKEYVEAERRNRLREFLLGSDAPEVLPDTTPIGELILEWLATDAHPDSVGGLARSTLGQLPLDRLTPHHRQPHRATHEEDGRDRRGRAGHQAARPEGRLRDRPPASSSTSGPPTSSSAGCKACAAAGVSRSTEAKAWTVISSALSWAVEDDSWPLRRMAA